VWQQLRNKCSLARHWQDHLPGSITCLALGCALTFASEAKFEIEAKILFRLEAKKKPDFT
jgi:hypothetical protein